MKNRHQGDLQTESRRLIAGVVPFKAPNRHPFLLRCNGGKQPFLLKNGLRLPAAEACAR